MAEASDAQSAVSKGVSGGGCGCGCLGVLVALIGVIVAIGAPLEFYDATSSGWYLSLGVAVVVTGLVTALVGAIVYIVGFLFVP